MLLIEHDGTPCNMFSLCSKLTYYIGATRSKNRVHYSKYQSGHQGCVHEPPHMCHLRIIFFTGDLKHYICHLHI